MAKTFLSKLNLKSKKIFILLPDGLGLRNFAFTQFVAIGEKLGWEVVFWNHTPFNLSSLGFKEIKLDGKPKAFTDLIKRAKINAELNYFEEKFKDPVYGSYKFKSSMKGLKSNIKYKLVSFLTNRYKGEKGLKSLRKMLKEAERRSNFYKDCLEILKKEKPDIVFSTSQRPVNAISPLTAAQDLKIPTATFIFSWDNLSKATMVVETDHYFVWSKFMKKELQSYYPYITAKQIQVTGTPQFETHYNKRLLVPREEFFNKHDLDLSKEYLCFSGDDVTTSPDDPQYLLDLAETVQELNSKGSNLGIIFRRCPVDFSGRYNEVLQKHQNVIREIAPLWKKQGEMWNSILPTKEDLALQANTINNSIAVVNLGSTMVFDAVAHNKPCFYINYDVKHKKIATWSTNKIYNYVHLRTMPSKNAVIWLNKREEIACKVSKLMNDNTQVSLKEAENWFKLINETPPEFASNRIWNAFSKII